jgi:hypothetical protein
VASPVSAKRGLVCEDCGRTIKRSQAYYITEICPSDQEHIIKNRYHIGCGPVPSGELFSHRRVGLLRRLWPRLTPPETDVPPVVKLYGPHHRRRG